MDTLAILVILFLTATGPELSPDFPPRIVDADTCQMQATLTRQAMALTFPGTSGTVMCVYLDGYELPGLPI